MLFVRANFTLRSTLTHFALQRARRAKNLKRQLPRLKVMRARRPREDLLVEFREIKLFAREEAIDESAERGKHRYGGYKV